MSESAKSDDRDELRKALSLELSSPQPDYQRIASLSAQFSDSDPDSARFSVDAGMVARLGRELVVRHETALSELVKNGFDADATKVVVHVARPGYGDYIEVSDNGVGMTRQELIHGFMRLATTAKINEPLSPRYGRRRAGRKGVGRFAAERLGRKLILTTATVDASDALRLEIEWDLFVAGSDLGSISVPVSVVNKTMLEGTTLRIEKLRDQWPTSALERTFKQVAHLVDPGNQAGPTGEGSEFFVQFRVDGRTFSVVDTRTEIATYAFATVEGAIDGSGYVTYGMKCWRLGIDFSGRPFRIGEAEASVAQHARDVKLKAYYFILDRANIPATAFSTVLAYLSNYGGVTVYRNGFRVPPYGQVGDDWLELDQLSSRRTQTLAPIRNRNFLGSIAISDEAGLFEETSSREGMIQSAALTELVEIVQSVLLTAVREIDAERERRKLKRAAPATKGVGLTQAPPPSPQEPGTVLALDLKQAVASARKVYEAAVGTGASDVPAQATFEKLEKLAEHVGQRASERDALLKEIDLLRVLASMGLAVGQFTHEFSTLSGAMRADLTVLMEQDRPSAEKEIAAVSLRTLLDQARAFSGLFKAMTEENTLRDRQAIDLYEAATSFKSALRSVLDRNGVDFEVADDGDEVITPPMHRSELFAILLNFTTNSIKAVKRARRRGRILVRLSTSVDQTAVLEFFDNGDGVAAEVRETMFDAFVTTTAATGKALADEDLALGSGLGLTIVRDIVTAVAGTVCLAEGEGEYTTCLRVEFPKISLAI